MQRSGEKIQYISNNSSLFSTKSDKIRSQLILLPKKHRQTVTHIILFETLPKQQQMSSLYFAVGKHGYSQQPYPGIVSTNPQKLLPVYKVISQHMNLNDKKEELDESIRDSPHSCSVIESQKSSKSLDSSVQKRVKYVVMNTGQMMEKQEVSSIDLEESINENNRDKEVSCHDTASSRVMTVIKNGGMKLSLLDGKTEKPECLSEFGDRTLLELELEKEKVLRRNLQKSYKNLLSKLRNEEMYQNAGYTERSQKTKRPLDSPAKTVIEHDQISEDNDFEEHDEKERMNKVKLRNSCCQLKGSKKREAENDSSKDEEQLENEYYQHLEKEKGFQARVIEELDVVREKIDQIEQSIFRREKELEKEAFKMQMLAKDNELLQLNLENLKLKQSSSHSQCHKDESSFSIREHMHYIFTIFMMFLVIVLLAKKQ